MCERLLGGGVVNGSHLLDGTYLIRVYPERCLRVFNGRKNVGRWKGNTAIFCDRGWGVTMGMVFVALTRDHIKEFKYNMRLCGCCCFAQRGYTGRTQPCCGFTQTWRPSAASSVPPTGELEKHWS